LGFLESSQQLHELVYARLVESHCHGGFPGGLLIQPRLFITRLHYRAIGGREVGGVDLGVLLSRVLLVLTYPIKEWSDRILEEHLNGEGVYHVSHGGGGLGHGRAKGLGLPLLTTCYFLKGGGEGRLVFDGLGVLGLEE